MALHLPIGRLKPTLCWSRYRDAISVPTSPLADAPSGLVRIQLCFSIINNEMKFQKKKKKKPTNVYSGLICLWKEGRKCFI